MSELDDLRRIAYGRTGSVAEEAAAADARAALARHEAASRAAREADEFVRARASAATAAAAEPEPEQPPAPAEAAAPDEPGYLRRLSATWRLWALPVVDAFVVGVAVTVASGMVILQASRTGPGPETNTSQRFLDDSQLITPGVAEEGTLAIESGDLEAATVVLARPRTAEDLIVELVRPIDSDSTRLLGSMSGRSVYAAASENGEICLVIVSAPAAQEAACVPPSAFSTQGVAVARIFGTDAVRVHWDGVDLVETVTEQ